LWAFASQTLYATTSAGRGAARRARRGARAGVAEAAGPTMTIRDLTSLADFGRVVEMEKTIWGYADATDVVSVPVFVITVKRGGILLGAFDDRGDLVGFVYSLVGLKHGRPMQWSHMLGVVSRHRSAGLGFALKVAQRQRTLAQGLDLIEWTYDPLQAGNAHFNFARLGVSAEEYAVDVYGPSSSALHAGCPTDRLIARWDIATRRVEERVGGGRPLAPPDVRDDALLLDPTVERGGWRVVREVRTVAADAPRAFVEVPGRFTEMLQDAPELAMEWRLATREVFTACLSRGFRVTEFFADPENGSGRYLLERVPFQEP